MSAHVWNEGFVSWKAFFKYLLKIPVKEDKSGWKINPAQLNKSNIWHTCVANIKLVRKLENLFTVLLRKLGHVERKIEEDVVMGRWKWVDTERWEDQNWGGETLCEKLWRWTLGDISSTKRRGWRMKTRCADPKSYYKFERQNFRTSRRIAPKLCTHVRIETRLTLS